MSEWISVRDDEPTDFTSVIIATRSGGVGEGYTADGTWRWVSGIIVYSEVAHWMPMPEPPGEEGE